MMRMTIILEILVFRLEGCENSYLKQCETINLDVPYGDHIHDCRKVARNPTGLNQHHGV